MLDATSLRQDQPRATRGRRGPPPTLECGCASALGAPCTPLLSRRPGPTLRRAAAHGFTLIESMLVTAVVGVLSAIAYPSFVGQVQKIRRADAILSMLQVHAAQERWRADNPSYGTLAEIGVGAISASGHYTLQVAGESAYGYEVLAAALGSQAHDTHCRNLRLRVERGNLIRASGTDAATNNAPQQNQQCWIV